MRKTKHFLYWISLFACMVVLLCVPAYPVLGAEESGLEYYNQEKGYYAVVEDNANLLTDEERTQLLEQMIPITEFGNVLFKTIDEKSFSMEGYAEKNNDKKFVVSSGVIFMIDMDNHELWVNGYGWMHDIVSSSHAYTITDNAYKLASAGRYYDCASMTFAQIYRQLDRGKIRQPLKYVSNTLLGIILALIINYFVVRGVASTAKPSGQKLMNSIGMVQEVENFEEELINTTKKFSPQSSSSRGGGHGF